MSQQQFSRRHFLRTSIIAIPGAMIAACSPPPPPPAPATPQPTQGTATPSQSQPIPVKASGKLTLYLRGATSDLQLYEEAIKGFEEAFPDVQVETQSGDCGFVYSTCKTVIAGGTMSDAFMPGNWTIQEMIVDGVVAPIDPLVEMSDFNLDQYLPATVKSLRGFSDNRLYALPLAYQCHAIYYNLDMFDKAGLAYPPADGDYTFQDLREWAKKLTLDDKGNDADSTAFEPATTKQWGFATLTTASVAYTWEYILMAFGGGSMTYPDGKQCNLEHPDTIRALQFIQDMYYKDHSTITPPVEQENSMAFRFGGGELAMMDAGFWANEIIQTQNPDLRYDVAALPREKAGNANNLYVEAWGIWSGAKNKDLAWEWIKHVTTTGYIVGMQRAMPALKQRVSSDEFLKAPGNPPNTKEAFVDSMSWPLALTASTYGPKFWQLVGQDGFGSALEDILLNKKLAAEAVSGICQRVDALVAE